MELANPIHINQIKRVMLSSRNADEAIKLYHGNMPYPVLQLFPSQYFWLERVGVDPKELPIHEVVPVDFFAEWRENNRTTTSGSRYKDVTRLHPAEEGRNAQPEVESLLVQINNKLDTLLYLHGVNS